jgi:hypothetical protein
MRLFEITDTPGNYLLGSEVQKIIDELCRLRMTSPLSATPQPTVVRGGQTRGARPPARPLPDMMPDPKSAIL